MVDRLFSVLGLFVIGLVSLFYSLWASIWWPLLQVIALFGSRKVFKKHENLATESWAAFGLSLTRLLDKGPPRWTEGQIREAYDSLFVGTLDPEELIEKLKQESL